MCNRILSRFEIDSIKKYSCTEVKLLKESWLKKFREINMSDMVKTDKSYDRYKKEIDSFLSDCTDVEEKPKKTVGELIIEARERRERGEGPWKDYLKK